MLHASATHQGLLRRAVEATTGSVWELGCGDYSTPFLHTLLDGKRRQLYSIDNNRDWLGRFEHLRSDWHTLWRVDHWGLVPTEQAYDGSPISAGVIFVDLAPAYWRAPVVEMLADRATYLVVHDTEDPRYSLDDVWPLFPWRFTDMSVRPWTTVVSKFQPWA